MQGKLSSLYTTHMSDMEDAPMTGRVVGDEKLQHKDPGRAGVRFAWGPAKVKPCHMSWWSNRCVPAWPRLNASNMNCLKLHYCTFTLVASTVLSRRCLTFTVTVLHCVQPALAGLVPEL